MVIYKPSRVDYTDLGVTLDNIENVTGQIRSFLFTGSQYVLAEFDSSTYSMELNYWDADGSEAVSRIMSKTGILDLTFDKEENCYYAVRWNSDAGFEGSPGLYWSSPTVFYDVFDAGDSKDSWLPRPELWTQAAPAWGTYAHHTQDAGIEWSVTDGDSWTLFRRNPSSERLEYRSNMGRGLLRTTLSVDGNFQAWSDFYMSKWLGSKSTFSMRLIDMDTVFTSYRKNNFMSQATFKGNYDSTDLPAQAGAWQGSHLYFSNSNTNGKWAIRNFRLRDRNLDDGSYNLQHGSYAVYTVSFYSYAASDDTNYFKIVNSSGTTLSDGVITNTDKSFNLVHGPVAFTLFGDPVNDLGNINGTSVQLNIRKDDSVDVGDATLETVSGTTLGFRLGVGIDGTNVYARRDIDAGNGWSSWQNINVYNLTPTVSRPMAVEMFADCISGTAAPDLDIDNFTIEATSGTTAWYDIPTLSVETYDSTGNSTVVAGVSDAEGYVIRKLNAIRYGIDSGGNITDLLNGGVVAITSDQVAEASGGSIFLLTRRFVGDTPALYKFKKDQFPLTAVEDGQNAEITDSGTLDYDGLYDIGSFGYSGYSGGEVAYSTMNWADVSRGRYLNTVLSGTLSGTNPRRAAWLQSSDFLAWNINDFDSLYGVTASGSLAGQIKLYDMTADTAAFCNVVTRTKLLAAGTSQTSTIVGQVMSVYGEPLSGKTVNFSVTAGDGAISPASAVTNVSGEAEATYTVGTAVTTSTITASVSI